MERRSVTSVEQITVRRRGGGLIARNVERTGDGVTMVAPQTSGGKVYLFMRGGSVARSRSMPRRPGRHSVILPNGNLGYSGYLEGLPSLYPYWDLCHGGSFEQVRPAGEVVWSFTDPQHHHDAQWLANGNIIYTACAPIPANFAARIVGGYAGDASPNGLIYGDVIRKIDRSGALIWEWRAWEHLDPAALPIPPILNRHFWPMINGLQITRDGRVLMSPCNKTGIIGVDRDGSVRFHIVADTVSHQHTPVEVEDATNLILDNGNFAWDRRHRSRALCRSTRRAGRWHGRTKFLSSLRSSRRLSAGRSGCPTATRTFPSTPTAIARRYAGG